MGLDMGIIVAKNKKLVEETSPMDRLDLDEILDNEQFYFTDTENNYPDIFQGWYARKFWDMVHAVPVLEENVRIDNYYFKIKKEDIKQMIEYYAFHRDYFDGFRGLADLCELYQRYDELTAGGWHFYGYLSY